MGSPIVITRPLEVICYMTSFLEVKMMIIYGFQCPKCFIRSGEVSIDKNDAPSCCGGIKMMPYEIPPYNGKGQR